MNIYLLTKLGGYVYDKDGNPVILGTTSGSDEPIDQAEFLSGMSVASGPHPEGINTFEVNEIEGKFHAMWNKTRLLGIHDTRSRALGQIAGTYVRHGSTGLYDQFILGDGEDASLLSIKVVPGKPTQSAGTPRVFFANTVGTATDVTFAWAVSGDTSNVTSALVGTGQSYTLSTQDSPGTATETVRVTCTAASVNAGITNVSDLAIVTLNHTALDPPDPEFPGIDMNGPVSVTAGQDETYAVTPQAGTTPGQTITYAWTVAGTTANVTSALTGATGDAYTLTTTDVEGTSPQDITISCTGTATIDGSPVDRSAGLTATITYSQPVDNTDLDFSVSVGTVSQGATATATVDASQNVLDPGETVNYTYNWFRQIPSLTGISLVNQGPSS